MPHAQLKLIPGADVIKTPVLNEAAISECQAIRYVPDQSGVAYPQKLGGWTRYFPDPLASIPRALWAWRDANQDSHLAVGCQTEETVANGAPLIVITDGSQKTITPHVRQDNVAVSVTTLTTTPIVTIDDTGSNINDFDSVFVTTHIAVGGIIIFGFYKCYAGADADEFKISLFNKLGLPDIPATGTTGGAVAEFTTSLGLAPVNVGLVNHGFFVGDTYPVLVSTTVGGITLYGNYTVTAIVDANNFTIVAASVATSSTSGFINGGLAQYDFYIGVGPLAAGTGFGVGGFGVGGFGSGSASSSIPGDPITADDWTLDNWGGYLVACPTGMTFGPDGTVDSGGPVYVWDPVSNFDVASAISQGAPVCNDGIFVAMPQRQIIAWGSTFNGIQDHLLIRWCDVDNFTVWLSTPTNQAGSRRLTTGSRIVAGLQVAQQGLLFTDVGVWAMQYIGPPDVYGFNEIGIGCGLIAKKAMTTLNSTVYWMGQTQFFTLSDAGVSAIPCPIWDVIFQNLDTDNVDKIRAAANSRFNEIAWYYPSANGGGEVDSYVKLNTVVGSWDFGTIGRTAWINDSILGAPIGADPNSLLFQHETSPDADGQPLLSSFKTGYFALSDTDRMIFVDQFYPDAKWGTYSGSQNASLQITFYTAAYPGDTPTAYGPYTVTRATQFISPRFRNRLLAFQVVSNDAGTFYRLGGPRYRYKADGVF